MVLPGLGTTRTIIRFLVEFSVKSCVHLSLGSEYANWLFGISTSHANLPEYVHWLSQLNHGTMWCCVHMGDK